MHEQTTAPPTAMNPEGHEADRAGHADEVEQRSYAALQTAIEASPRDVDAPRVWIATSEDYEARTLNGRWLAAARPFAEVDREIQAVLDASPYAKTHGVQPHWQAYAAEGFGWHTPTASAPLHDIVQRAWHAHDEAAAYVAWTTIVQANPEACRAFQTAYQGRFDSLHDYVTLLVEQAGYDRLLDERLPGSLRPFVDIDIDGLGHDLVASGDIVAIPTGQRGLWIFVPAGGRKALPDRRE